jgi:hypothetical protein
LSNKAVFIVTTASAMSSFFRKTSKLISKRKSSSNSSLSTVKTPIDTSVDGQTTAESDTNTLEQQQQDLSGVIASPETAGVVQEECGASGTAEQHAEGPENYPEFLEAARAAIAAQRADSTTASSPGSKDRPKKLTRAEIWQMRENKLSSIGEESEKHSRPVTPREPESEPDDHADYVVRHAYKWPSVPDERLALRLLRLAAFREYQKRSTGQHRLSWLAEAEISIGREMLLGGNCLADADLFDKYDGPVQQLEPSEREHYNFLYGFLPEQVRALRDNDDVVLSINRAASVRMKIELYANEVNSIEEMVQTLYVMAQGKDKSGLDGVPDERDDQREGFDRLVMHIERQWGVLMNLAVKRRHINDGILEAAAKGDNIKMLMLAEKLKTGDGIIGGPESEEIACDGLSSV